MAFGKGSKYGSLSVGRDTKHFPNRIQRYAAGAYIRSLSVPF